ncbi:MAG: aldehyde dehydrogenase family protein, partial [Actinomycetota bacterium]|nr:aldehyde dehydrogenase family protein [Actinomycetota bacterium]
MPNVTLYNPTTEAEISSLPSATVEETDAAIAKAKAAGPVWRGIAPADRARLMRRYADVIADHAQELGEMETRNMGMTIGNSVWCAQNASNVMHY